MEPLPSALLALSTAPRRAGAVSTWKCTSNLHGNRGERLGVKLRSTEGQSSSVPDKICRIGCFLFENTEVNKEEIPELAEFLRMLPHESNFRFSKVSSLVGLVGWRNATERILISARHQAVFSNSYDGEGCTRGDTVRFRVDWLVLPSEC